MSVTATNPFADTISTLEASTTSYDSVKDFKDLPDAFHEAARGQSTVQRALRDALSALGSQKPTERVAKLVEKCRAKAKLSEGIFRDVASAPDGSRFERYKAAVRDRKGGTVETLILQMMKDVCTLAEDEAMKEAMGGHATELRTMIDKLSKMEPSLPTEEARHSLTKLGNDQIITLGGHSIVNRSEGGTGHHFPGASFSGPVSFGKT